MAEAAGNRRTGSGNHVSNTISPRLQDARRLLGPSCRRTAVLEYLFHCSPRPSTSAAEPCPRNCWRSMFTLKLHGRRPLACLVVIVAAVWPSTGSARQSAPARDYSTEAAVVEQMYARYKFEQNGTGRRQMDVRVKVQSEAGVQQFGQLIFGYNAANER